MSEPKLLDSDLVDDDESQLESGLIEKQLTELQTLRFGHVLSNRISNECPVVSYAADSLFAHIDSLGDEFPYNPVSGLQIHMLWEDAPQVIEKVEQNGKSISVVDQYQAIHLYFNRDWLNYIGLYMEVPGLDDLKRKLGLEHITIDGLQYVCIVITTLDRSFSFNVYKDSLKKLEEAVANLRTQYSLDENASIFDLKNAVYLAETSAKIKKYALDVLIPGIDADNTNLISAWEKIMKEASYDEYSFLRDKIVDELYAQAVYDAYAKCANAMGIQTHNYEDDRSLPEAMKKLSDTFAWRVKVLQIPEDEDFVVPDSYTNALQSQITKLNLSPNATYKDVEIALFNEGLSNLPSKYTNLFKEAPTFNGPEDLMNYINTRHRTLTAETYELDPSVSWGTIYTKVYQGDPSTNPLNKSGVDWSPLEDRHGARQDAYEFPQAGEIHEGLGLLIGLYVGSTPYKATFEYLAPDGRLILKERAAIEFPDKKRLSRV